jgi:hypothetical protein
MMSDRERWIVYPMLVLSLALGAKTRWDAFRGTSEFQVLTCRTLVVQNELDEEQIVLQQNSQGAAELSLLGADGVEARLLTDEGGGQLLLLRRSDQKALVLGHDKLQEISGVWAIDAEGAETGLVPLSADATKGEAWRLLPWPIAAENDADSKGEVQEKDLNKKEKQNDEP